MTNQVIKERGSTLSEDVHHELNRRITNILESITDAFFALNHDWRFTYVNRQAERFLQKKREELLGKKIWNTFPEFVNSTFYKKCHEVIETQLSLEFEEFYDPLHKWFKVHVNPSRDGLSVYFDDLTEIKELEQQREVLVGIAGHELKNSLAGVKAFSQILEKRFKMLGDDKSLLYLSKIDTQVNKIVKIMNDLLDVTKLRTGKLKFQKQIFHFDALVLETIEQMQVVSQTHRIVKKGEVKKYILADRDRIGQVLVNFISNAIKFSPDADTVVVRVWGDREDVKVGVQDFGIGIPLESRKRIFEMFYRVHPSKRDVFPGLGIGLYIAQEIVKYHEGRIWVESTEGKGSTFYFTLPIKSESKRTE